MNHEIKTPKQQLLDTERRELNQAIELLKLHGSNVNMAIQGGNSYGLNEKRIGKIIFIADDIVNVANDITRRLNGINELKISMEAGQ